MKNLETPSKGLKKVLCKCEGCGTEFYKFASQVKIGRGRFCSKRCQYNAVHTWTKNPPHLTGEQNPKWKGGISALWYRRVAFEEYGFPQKCMACGTESDKLHIHHRDHDHTNYSRENLQVLCSPCHYKVHKAEGIVGFPKGNPGGRMTKRFQGPA